MSLRRRRISADDWIPVGVAALEANALTVVRSGDNRSVIAGPGAGKTELLAQRAAYLLQTGVSPHPRRILAISFKRDAASNLATRVRQRCHPEVGRRFDSMTFDAFAKSLVDRFGQALPDAWRPTPNYRIDFPRTNTYRDFLSSLGNPPAAVGTRGELEAIGSREFERELLFGSPLPREWPVRPNVGQWATRKFWEASLMARGGSALSFPMISRLAELIIRINAYLRQALALTYSHVFLDEFQDTTHVQYQLTRTIFCRSPTVLTAVGDNKQQIMRWAMAMADPFAAFERDFNATRTTLLNNYRSSPELVRIQHVLAQAIDAGSLQAVSMTPGDIAGESCEVWDFRRQELEATGVASFIAAEIAAHGLRPRDFVLLVRQRAGDYMRLLEPALAAEGIVLRNEAAEIGPVRLQELLAEELSDLVVRVLRLSTAERAGRAWTECLEILADLRGIATERGEYAHLGRELERFTAALKRQFPEPPPDAQTVTVLVGMILDFINRSEIAAAYPAYRQGDWMLKVIEAVTVHLGNSCEGQDDWSSALDAYEGTHSLPLMTIHKSKGLEYHTVVFLGLDDGAWWSFARDQAEATAGFFVAFTRAKQRVLFTYCPARGHRRQIAPLYELLERAGVQTVTK